MKIYFKVEKIEGCMPWGVRDMALDILVASFPEEYHAKCHADSLSTRKTISCCKTSLSSNGWHHCSSCDRTIPDDVPDEKGAYRTYYSIPFGGGKRATHFKLTGQNEWFCTHGDWYGTVENGEELTLHHVYGEATYDSYEDTCEDGVRLINDA